jgi:hypothetical protein
MFQGCQNWSWISQGVLGSNFIALPGIPGGWAIQLYCMNTYIHSYIHVDDDEPLTSADFARRHRPFRNYPDMGEVERVQVSQPFSFSFHSLVLIFVFSG